MSSIKIGSLTCKPINGGFGAVIEGIDFSKVVPENQIRDVIAAQDRFGVTVYRNTGLDDVGHIRFSRQLGDLEKAPRLQPNAPPRFDHPELFDAGNTDRDGNIIQKDTRRWWWNRGKELWHTDSSFNQHRSKYSLLLAHTIPKAGGNTNYADVRRAFRDLPEERKAQLRGLVAKHDLWHSRMLAAPEVYKEATEHERTVKPPAYHKLVQIAPDGEETLYIAAHISEIVGMSYDEGQKLVWDLIKHCTQPQYVISAKWEQPSDLVFWDNRTTMHTATPFDDQAEKRDMRRTTVFDDGLDAFGVRKA